MKKLLSFLLVSVFVFTLGFSSVSAEYSEGDELIPNGDLSFNAGELLFPDPVFDSDFGPAEGWGSLAFDSRAIALTDPDDVSNTVLKLSLSDAGENWSSFFRFLPIQTSTVYNVSIDFKIVGTTDNIGIRFAGAPALEVVFLDHPSKTAIEGKDGWHNVQFQFDTTTGTYDSIALWFHTMGSADNYALLDNISIIADGTTNEINEGGDFEGFLDFVPGLELTASTDANGYFGALAAFGNGKATINDGGHLAYEKDFTADMHRVGFDFEITDLTNGNVSVGFYDSSDTLITSAPVVTNGVLDLNNVTEDSNVYTFNADIDVISAASYIKFDYSGDSVLLVDNLSAKKLVEIPDNPFDPDTIYYETTQLLENGDFEAFDVDTVFSEEQLEGAWGSISLDGPAKIMSVDGSKVMAIGQTSGKMYSSSFVMTPPDLMVGDLLRLRYDFKLNLDSPVGDYVVIDSSFVGASNTPYYAVDLSNLEDGDLTVGNELLLMPITVSDNGNGWATVEMDFEVTTEFLIKCNSLRFLFTPINATDYLYIDNVELFLLGDTEPVDNVTALEIDQDDKELDVGQEVTLTVTVTPSDADNAALEWSSENDSIATVNQNGKVTAVAEGATTITVELEDGSFSDSIIVTVFPIKEEKTGCFGSITIGSLSTLIIMSGAAGTVLFIKRKRK